MGVFRRINNSLRSKKIKEPHLAALFVFGRYKTKGSKYFFKLLTNNDHAFSWLSSKGI